MEYNNENKINNNNLYKMNEEYKSVDSIDNEIINLDTQNKDSNILNDEKNEFSNYTNIDESLNNITQDILISDIQSLPLTSNSVNNSNKNQSFNSNKSYYKHNVNYNDNNQTNINNENYYYRNNIENFNKTTSKINEECLSIENNYTNKTNTNCLNYNDNNQLNSKLLVEIFNKEFVRLIQSNKEFLYLLIFSIIYFFIILFEFISGILLSNINILSDSFFNIFKSLSFIIALISILLSKSYSFSKFFSTDYNSFLSINRIELLSAITNCITLIIVSIYMTLSALHMVTENKQEEDELLNMSNNSNPSIINKYKNKHNHFHLQKETLVNFNLYFYVIKILFDTAYLLVFSDYIIHQSINIKLMLFKINNSSNLLDTSLNKLSKAKSLIKEFNSHFDNLNILSVCVLTDLISTLVMHIGIYLVYNSFEKVYMIGCFINLFTVSVLITPVLYSLICVFMYMKYPLYTPLYKEVHKKLSLNEDILNFNSIYNDSSSNNNNSNNNNNRSSDIKWAMISQNELVCYMKLTVKSLYFDKEALKNEIYECGKTIGVNIKILMDTIVNN